MTGNRSHSAHASPLSARKPRLRALPWLAVGATLLLAACGGSDGSTPQAASAPASSLADSSENAPPTTAAAAPTAQAPTPTGCTPDGQSRALEILDPAFKLKGPNPVGGVGDYLLTNENAAFVITGKGPQKTYYHYNGILVDAVALDHCEQIVNENFFEMPLMVSRLNIAHQALSTFRAFNAERIEVINDGSDGKAAIVRATGSDDIYWLLELELVARAALEGSPKVRSEPLGLAIEVNYILEPHSPTLKIEYRLINQLNDFNSLSMAFVLLSSGGGPLLNTFSAFDADIEGLNLKYGIPWVTASDGNGGYAYGATSDVLTTTHIAGVDALFDARQFGNTWFGQLLAANGHPKDTLKKDFYVTVNQGDELATVKAYLATTPASVKTVNTLVNGSVTETQSGTPLSGVKVEFQTQKQNFLKDWPWETFLTTYSDANGRFGGDIPLISYLPSDQAYRVIASSEGRQASAPADIQPAQTNDISLGLGEEGNISYRLVDQDGKPSPGRVSVYQNNALVKRLYSVTGSGDFKLPPGNYDVGISRGFEYAVVDTPLGVSPGITASLNATLRHMVDTTGYLSFDAHVHSTPSPDSTASVTDRIRTAAATGLEVVVATDHEIMTDLKPAVAEVQAQDVVATVIGQEVTAAVPNHTIAYPLNYNPDAQPPRQFVAWHGKDIAGIFAEEAKNGAQIRTFAHPRSDYLNLIQWDRLAGAPGMTDPTVLGFPADATLWSWDFEAMEYMNGPEKVFSSGLFEDWMSFINHGHRIAGTGASDVHDLELPGMPRNYYVSPTDKPREFQEADLISAVKKGQLVVSTGAFARVSINGVAQLGDTVTDTDGVFDLALQVQAIPQIDVDHVRVYVNCDEVARFPAENPADSALKLDLTSSIPLAGNKDAHVVVLGFGKEKYHREFKQFDPTEVPRFTTNPIYIDADGDGIFSAPGGKHCQF